MTALELSVSDATVWTVTYGHQLCSWSIYYAPRVVNYAPRVINYAPIVVNYAPREHL